MHRRLTSCVSVAFILILSSCSEAPRPAAEKPKEPEKPAEPATGRFAFHQMFVSARAWARDAQPLRLSSIHLAEVKSEPGKAGAWQAYFVSLSQAKARAYTYSVVDAPGNLHKGVFAGLEETYTGPRGQATPFPVAALKTDSDEVYATALQHAAQYAKKYPDLPISFLLEKTPRFPNPAWRVIWGESVGSSNFSIYVDATTGKYLQTMR